MAIISAEQRLELAFKLVQHADWANLASEQVQVGIDHAHIFAGQEFTSFIRNGFRMQFGDFYREMEQVAIQIPALPRPTPEQLQKHGIVRIERDISPTCAVTLRLGTLLGAEEERIDGLEYECRLLSVRGLFGYQQLRYLVDHQDESQVFRDLIGKIYVDGPGIIGVNACGFRCFPYLFRYGKRWYLYWIHVSFGLHRGGRIASSGK